MYQPTTTPDRSCNKDLPLVPTFGEIQFSATSGKYGLHRMPEGSSMAVTFQESDFESEAAWQLGYSVQRLRLSVAVCNYGKATGKTFSVITEKDNNNNMITGLTVYRY